MQLIQALRGATAELHRKLDDAVSERPIVTRSGYVRFLSMHAGVLPDAERWLMQTPEFATLPHFRQRLRTSALERDMDILEVAPPAPVGMSFLNDDSSVAGICYVLEGSRLGAAHLCALLDKSDASLPTAFLRHGTQHRHWKTFLGWLAEQDCSASAIERAIFSARKMFESYLEALVEQDKNRMLAVGTS